MARPRGRRASVAATTTTALIGLLLVASPQASAQTRMWIGFHDDPGLRYGPDRQRELDLARSRANATMLRTLVTWRQIAPTRPQNAADPFDPAYHFDDLDDFVRSAQVRGLEVLMTIWGTPAWANGGRPARFLPTRMSDFRRSHARLRPATRVATPATRSSASSASGTSRISTASSRPSSTR